MLMEHYDKDTKNINRIAIPLMLSSLTSVLISLVDQAMIGRISIIGYGAVGIVSSTLYSVIGILGMLAVGFNILGAQNVEKNQDDLFFKFRITLILSIVIGIISFIVINIFKYPILEVFFGLKGDLLIQASKFLSIYSISIGLNLMLFVFSSLFKILKKTKYIFWGSLITNLINIVLDYILIFGKLGFQPMGVTGAAIASTSALFINVVFYIILVRKDNIFKLRFLKIKSYIKELIKITIPLMGQEFLDGTLFNIVLIAIISRIGVIEVSAYTLLTSIISILLMPMFAYSSTSLNLVSGYSSDEFYKLESTPKKCLLMTILFYVAMSLIIIIFKNDISMLVTNDDDVKNLASTYIFIALLSCFFNLFHTIYKCSLQGLKDEKFVFFISALINFISLALIFLFLCILKLNLTGVYLGLNLNYLSLSIVFYYRYINSIKEKFPICKSC